MAYKKFDDANLNVSQAPRKVYNAIPIESIRRAVQSVSNRILCGTCGTAALADWRASCGTGGDSATDGLGYRTPLFVIVNATISCLSELRLQTPSLSISFPAPSTVRRGRFLLGMKAPRPPQLCSRICRMVMLHSAICCLRLLREPHGTVQRTVWLAA